LEKVVSRKEAIILMVITNRPGGRLSEMRANLDSHPQSISTLYNRPSLG
jgi:hypothetical protein